MLGLIAEVAAAAIKDAGLRREDIDGLLTYGGDNSPSLVAEYAGIRPTRFAVGSQMAGASAGVALTIAAHVVATGMANYVMFVGGGARDPSNPRGSIFMADVLRPTPPSGIPGEFVDPYGPAVPNGNFYAMIYTRHMYQYGTTSEQMARIAVNQRFNAQANPLSAFYGQPITVQDVLNSRWVNYPLHLLEVVMPAAGAIAFIVASAERARSLPNQPAYLLGAGVRQGYHNPWLNPDFTRVPAAESAPAAFQMARYGPKDVQFAQMYDCYTILEAVSLEDCGICPKGEIGPFFENTDTTYKGRFPINTDGGQLSAGQLNGAGASGTQQVVEAARQLMGRAGERQVARKDLALVNL